MLKKILSQFNFSSTVLKRSCFLLFILTFCLSFIVYNNSQENSNQENINDTPDFIPDTNNTVCLNQELTQFGITWIFNKEYPTGQFANGDYWVAGSTVRIIGTNPLSINSNGRIINGGMINPDIISNQGFDSMLGGDEYEANYIPDLNVLRPNGKDLSEANPLDISPKPIVSLICGISVPEIGTGICHQVPTMAILTIVDTIPPDGSFRPPYCGSNKSVKFNTTTVYDNYNLLSTLDHVDETFPLYEVENCFEKPWIDNWEAWSGELFHPINNMPHYGREMSNQVGIGALTLHLSFENNFPGGDKDTLLFRYIQLGIDNYAVTQVPGGRVAWKADGGHMSGRVWPIIFAGLMLENDEMKNICAKSGDYAYTGVFIEGNLPLDYLHFGELDQTFYVKQSDINRDHHPDPRSVEIEYSAADLNLPEWGILHAWDPVGDNRNWDSIYRFCTGISWSGFILATYLTDINTAEDVKTLWNHNALFDYQDRYMEEMKTFNPEERTYDNFTENMWDTYRIREGHPVVWGE